MKKVTWNDIKHLVTPLLTEQMDGSDLNCGQSIWQFLEENKLTSYANEIGKTKILVLVLGLVEFVNDCTSLTRDDAYELDILQWAYEIEYQN